MKFTLSTKPLVDALNLCIINSNVSKFYSKSCMAQITASSHELAVNTEASFISSKVILKGSGDSDETCRVFVDALLLKQLVSTFESSVVTLEFLENGLTLHSGQSKFNLPKMIESGELSLKDPSEIGPESTSIKLKKDDWKFISDYQMFAIAMSFVYPVYTRVWVGDKGDVIVGDFNNSLFTFSKKNGLGSTCLLSDTIINLLNSIPEGAQISNIGTSYRIDVKTDGFEYASQFTPQYEEDEGVGDYNSQIFLDMVDKNSNCIKTSILPIKKLLSQADLLSTNSEDTISVSYKDSELKIWDSNVDSHIKVESTCPEFTIEFKTSLMKSVISNLDSETINMYPCISEGVCSGLLFWTDNMSVILGGVE